MKIIANDKGVASGRIYNIGNPANQHSVKELAEMMLAMAMEYPEYAVSAKNSKIVETSAAKFYGQGYQDVQNRSPKITATVDELGWSPTIDMKESLRRIFEAYKSKVGEARSLTEQAV
jgi:nucleoside-diphosphate-sugar epimerase